MRHPASRDDRGPRLRCGGAAARALLAALCLAAPGTPAGALNISSGDVVARRLGAFGFVDSNNSYLSFAGNSNDELFQMFGYIGNATGTVRIDEPSFDIDTDIAETTPGTATSSVSLDANGAASLGLAAGDLTIDYSFTLVDDTSPADVDGFLWNMSVTNNSASDLTLTVYQYLDLDLDGDAADDLVSATASRMLVTDDGTGNTFIWRSANAAPASHFQVEDFGAAGTLRTLLDSMGPAADLSDAAANFGPGDFTGAYQYDFFLPAGTTFVLASGEVAVPEPNPALLTSAGLIGISLVSRRARRRALAARGELRARAA